jgi:excisionase family DNA binding protein
MEAGMRGKGLTGDPGLVSGTRRQGQGGAERRFFNVAEVADIVGVSPRTVRRWIKDEKLVAHYFGRAVRIAESDLRAFIARHRRI